MSESSSPNSADNKQISPEKEKENVQKQSTGKEGKKDIAEGREVLVNPFGGGMRRSLCLKRKREVTIETEEPVGEQSDTHEKEDKTSEDSVVSPGETDFERTLREYDEHCQRADLSPEVWDMKMTFDEFCCQEKIDEEEFGPDENLHTIRRECLDLGLPMKYTDREFRMRANRFKEVQRRKRRKEEEVKTASEPDYASNEQSKTESKRMLEVMELGGSTNGAKKEESCSLDMSTEKAISVREGEKGEEEVLDEKLMIQSSLEISSFIHEGGQAEPRDI